MYPQIPRLLTSQRLDYSSERTSIMETLQLQMEPGLSDAKIDAISTHVELLRAMPGGKGTNNDVKTWVMTFMHNYYPGEDLEWVEEITWDGKTFPRRSPTSLLLDIDAWAPTTFKSGCKSELVMAIMMASGVCPVAAFPH